jgi:hypothetical protein
MEMDKRACIVVAPEVLAKSFLLDEYRELLVQWRDGTIRLVVTRDLLVCYLRLLKRLGLPEAQLRQWSAWFTAPEKAVFLPQAIGGTGCGRDILRDAVIRGKASSVVCGMPVESADGVPWITVSEFLTR